MLSSLGGAVVSLEFVTSCWGLLAENSSQSDMIFFFLCFQSLLLLFPPFGATTAAAHANQGVCKLLEPATETNGKPCNAHVSTPGGKGKDPNPTGHPPPKVKNMAMLETGDTPSQDEPHVASPGWVGKELGWLFRTENAFLPSLVWDAYVRSITLLRIAWKAFRPRNPGRSPPSNTVVCQ